MIRAFVIGHPIAHSRSPLIHGHWLQELGIGGSYERIDVAPAELGTFLSSFQAHGFVGGNVTVPHKKAAFRLVDELTGEARRLGAVNTLSLTPQGHVRGHNTDGAGFVDSVREAVGPDWQRQAATAVVIGAGGAARAIVAALLDLGSARIRVVNRTTARADDIRSFDPSRVEAIAWGDRSSALDRADLLVNASTLGMVGQPSLDLRLDLLPPTAIVADLVYVPLVTPLLAAARERGLRTVSGIGMLLHQAVPGFRTWFGGVPVVTPALRALVERDVERGA